MASPARPARRTADPGPVVAYRWDAATGILSARIGPVAPDVASISLAGRDGSWVTLDIADDRLAGIEIVVWPDVRVMSLAIPAPSFARRCGWRALAARGPVRVLGAPLAAAHDPARGVVRLRVAGRPVARTVREAPAVLVDLDPAGALAGLWLCDVPPLPEGT